MLAVFIFHCYTQKKQYPLPTLFLVLQAYMLFESSVIPFVAKKKVINALKYGCLIFGSIGLVYMFSTGNIARGGEYVTNSWGISNLTVSLFFSFYVVSDCISTLKAEKKLKRQLIVAKLILWSLTFLFIIFLGKRGPIIFTLFSVFIASILYNRNLKRIILAVLFLYPIWELPLVVFVTDFFADRSEIIFERMNDFDNVEDNPRIIRLQAAGVFLTDITPRDLFGYHEEIILSKNMADTEHNHFHNFLLQLYYERGLLCTLAVLFVLLLYKEKKGSRSSCQQCAFGMMVLLLLVGTNESLLLSGTAQEMLFYITYLYHKQVYVFEKNL